MHGGDVMRFGRFELTVIRSAHHPQRFGEGEIDAPLHPPASAFTYREGGSYQLLVRHGDRSLLINASAGFVAGALAGRRADVVFLGIGGLGRDDDTYRNAYWDQVVRAVHAKRVIPIHWDNLSLPLEKGLLPSPYLFDDMDKSMQFLLERGHSENVDVRLELPWIAVDPFQGLTDQETVGHG
jgi:L-ascorbate metabolism protein UlaG (beta-lactamase superfamily)